MEIKKATRKGVTPLIGLFSESGAGKTYSSLLMARGFVGPKGKIVLADSERGRGSLYADVLPGGYDVLDIEEPFSPKKYMDVMRAVEESGATIGIIDSVSHEWEGVGGVLDMAADNEKKWGKSLLSWKTPKTEHSKFVSALMRSQIPWIICLRAKFKTRQGKDDKGKTAIIKDEFISPIQAEDFLFEMTAHMEILMDHKVRLTKWSHPELRKCFPTDGPITTETGSMVAKWCSAGGSSTSVQSSPAPTTKGSPPADSTISPTVGVLKKELWDLTKEFHGGNKMAFEQYLIDEKFIEPDENIASLNVERLEQLIMKVNQKPTE